MNRIQMSLKWNTTTSNNGQAIRKVCREFVVVCGRVGLLAATTVAIDGSKFKAVNSRDRNFTQTKVAKRLPVGPKRKQLR